MKKTIKLIAVTLVMAMMIVLLPALPAFAADENTILVGEGQTYTTISGAITALTANGLKGKTIKLTSDIEEAAGNLTIALTGGGEITIDGDGHKVTNFKTIITSSTTTDLTVVTIKNITFERPNPDTANLGNHPIAYARGNSRVILDNVTAVKGFNYIIGLNDAGNTHAVINSGVYATNAFLFRANYNTCTKTAGSVTINGGNFYFGEGTDAMLSLSGNVAVDINGGNFFCTNDAPIAFDVGMYTAETGSKVSVTIDGANFLYPSTTTQFFGYNNEKFTADNGKTPMTVTIGTGNVFAPVVEGAASNVNSTFVKTYGLVEATAENYAEISGITFTTANELANVFGKLYLQNGAKAPVNADVLATLDAPIFDGAILSLTADTDATMDFATAHIAVAKNGKTAANIKSTNGAAMIVENFTDNFADQDLTILVKKNEDGTANVRIVAVLAGTAYSKAGVVYTTGDDTSVVKYNNLGKYAEGVKTVETTDYYTSLIAGGRTYDAVEAGGNAFVILTIENVAVGTTLNFKAYGITSAGAEYSNLGTYTVAFAE